jgi:hypothetical protein
MLSDGVKKLLAYLVILLLLIAAVIVVWHVSETRRLLSHPDAFVYDENPSPADFLPRPSSSDAPFVKPVISAGEPMDVSELAWMIRERITLGVIGDFMAGGSGASAYNDRAREYNRMASSMLATDSSASAAEKRAGGLHAEIIADALREAFEIAMPERAKADPKMAAVWKTQSFLRLLSIYAGRPNGIEDDETAYAIKTYQLRAGKSQTGRVDEALLAELRSLYVRRKLEEGARIE